MLQAQHMEDERTQELFLTFLNGTDTSHLPLELKEKSGARSMGESLLWSRCHLLLIIIHPSAFSGEFGTPPFILTWLLFMRDTNRLLLLRQHTEHNV